jgi:HlyD family secretion protein
VVSLLNVKKGERVVGSSMMAGTEMMRIADLRKIEVRVDVGENDIPKVHLGDSALVEVDAYNNRKFKGIVTQIASSNNGAASVTGLTGTEVTNYKVYIRLLPESYQDLLDPAKPKSFPFRPGMSASADIQTKTHENRLSVPINAVTTRDVSDSTETRNDVADKNDKSTEEKNMDADELEEVVFVLQKDGSVKKVKVRTDIQDINYIEILAGLKEGDEIITGPYEVVSKTLKTTTKVKVVQKSELFDKKK